MANDMKVVFGFLFFSIGLSLGLSLGLSFGIAIPRYFNFEFEHRDKVFTQAKEICLKNDSTVKYFDLDKNFTCENGIEFNLGGVGE